MRCALRIRSSVGAPMALGGTCTTLLLWDLGDDPFVRFLGGIHSPETAKQPQKLPSSSFLLHDLLLIDFVHMNELEKELGFHTHCCCVCGACVRACTCIWLFLSDLRENSRRGNSRRGNVLLVVLKNLTPSIYYFLSFGGGVH